jgi:4-hydroxybenzoate polyprenyltransferase
VIRRIRLFVVLARPDVVLLFGMFDAIGLAQGGYANDGVLLAKALVAVVAFLLFSVAVNDLADERIDRVNLAGNAARPLVVGTGTRHEMRIVAGVSAVLALAACATLHWPAPLVVAAGLALSAAYSLRPIRIADRGVLAPMMLPLGYVAVPYLLGICAARGTFTATDFLLLAGLYAGFVGRIILKDFRDVRGDALFGKRTFLVRHGRIATCVLSAVFLVIGTAVLPFVRECSVSLLGAYAVFLALTLGFLRALARSTGARRDTALVSAIAICGRGMLLGLYAHFAFVAAQWSTAAAAAAMAALTALMVHDAVVTARYGPRSNLVVPPSFRAEREESYPSTPSRLSAASMGSASVVAK